MIVHTSASYIEYMYDTYMISADRCLIYYFKTKGFIRTKTKGFFTALYIHIYISFTGN